MQNNQENNLNKIQNPYAKMEEEVLDFWDESKIFEKSVDRPSEKGDYVFYDGPPFATGTPHYGHIVASTMKDVVPRYWTMKGYRVERKWGWDCHGLPIENIAEKEMGIKSKKQIKELGVEKFNEICRSKVLSYVEDWKIVIRRIGRWVDMENAYKTMDLDFMESVWWVFKQLWDKDLIYEGYRSMHICPRCETTLSQQEVAEGYKMINDLSVIVKFKLEGEDETFILAWTTTPWTLIGNVALAVGENIDYVLFKIIDNESRIANKYIAAKDRVGEVLKDKQYEIIKEFKGKELVGKKYKPLFDYYIEDEKIKNKENGWKIYAADFVTTEDGVGIVHIAPAFGDDDMNLGKKFNLPFIQHIGMDGIIKPEAKDFVGMSVKPMGDHKKTDVEIIKNLASRNLLFDKKKYEHSYPHCWRCETPLINYATTSWFVAVTKIKNRLLEHAKEINWFPSHIKEGRFGNWLSGSRDWSISRQRFWASVMPIWRCSCGEIKVFGSIAELEKISNKKITDLHKHTIDKITFKCEKCSEEVKRVPDVLDTWFDSGSMIYAQMHYPFENKEKFESNFPAEFIAEGIDQTRAWFYYLHVIGGAINNSHAFKNVVVNGIVLAEDGKKMAKRLKNYADPTEVFNKYGADAMRYYLTSSPVMAAENLNFSEKGVKEALQKNVMLLWNIYKFYELFVQEFNQEVVVNGIKEKSKNVLDVWICVCLKQLIKNSTESLDNYDLPKYTRPISEFINDFSTWYIRRSRDRFKAGASQGEAIETTKFVLLELAKVIAPVMPFIAETIWQKIIGYNFKNRDKSVHLEKWPEQSQITNYELEVLEEMEKTRKVIELGLRARDEAEIKVRQPLTSLKIKMQKSKIKNNEEYLNLIKEELNVKNIICEKGDGDISIKLDINITPELKLEGIKREIVRFVNVARKDSGLNLKDRTEIFYSTDSKLILSAIETFRKEILKDTLSNKIENIKDTIDLKDVKIDGDFLKLGIKKNNS